MECIEARALKSSFFLSQMGMMKTNSSFSSQQLQYDDALVGGNSNSNNVVACDDFPVEDLLNLDFNGKEICFSAEEEEEEDGDDVAEKSEKFSYSSSCSTFSSVVEDSLSVGELAVPYDDLENLEWLSQFVDDSTSNLSTLLYPIECFTKKPGSTSSESDRSKQANSDHPKVHAQRFPMPFPRRPRNKRSRSSGQRWSSSSQPLMITTSPSSSSLSSNGSSPFPFANQFHNTDGSDDPPAKKQKRKFEPRTGSTIGRRCTHCQVQKTPQWRTGPLGPKTLCNACGVRYKSGRLFPEYLPACSPLFSQEVHSNSHRKVLELRRKKEMAEPALARVVPSC